MLAIKQNIRSVLSKVPGTILINCPSSADIPNMGPIKIQMYFVLLESLYQMISISEVSE